MNPTPPPPTEPAPPARRTGLVVAGGVAALVAGGAIAWALVSQGQGTRTPEPPASQGGLVIDQAAPDDALDPARPLRCFVAGQFVGEFTLAECARRNGVATDALDVGVDETGALAAAEQAGTTFSPLPPDETAETAVEPLEGVGADPAAAPVDEPLAACWRYAQGRWRKMPDMARMACAQALFAGRCETTGSATYGRWGQQTLRLVPGRVEMSDDNRTFRTLVEQQPGCVIP